MADGSFGERSPRFEELYRSHREHVRIALRQHHVAPADLEDLQQEVFVVLLNKLDARVDRDRLRAWLFQVARRVASNHRRGLRRLERKRNNAWRELPRACPEEQLLRKEGLELLDEFVRSMDPTTARMFLLAEVQGLRGGEIAEHLGVPLHAVYPRLRKARHCFEQFVRRRTQSTLRSVVPGWWSRFWASVQRMLGVEWAPLAGAALVLAWVIVPSPEPAPAQHATSVASSVPAADSAPVVQPTAPPPRAAPAAAEPKRRSKPRASRARTPVVSPTPVAAVPAEAVRAPAAVVEAVSHLSPILDEELPPRLPRAAPSPETLRGTVVDGEGQLLANARVYCRRIDGLRRRPCARPSALTDGRGRFELGKLGRGEYQLVAFRAGTNATTSDDVLIAWGADAPPPVVLETD
jgi:RNA polymerase sigma-70 factor (ECF subfamily)